MPTYTPAQKKAIYKYRETHDEEYSKYNKNFQKQYYLDNKVKLAKMKSDLWFYRKECNRLRTMIFAILDI